MGHRSGAAQWPVPGRRPPTRRLRRARSGLGRGGGWPGLGGVKAAAGTARARLLEAGPGAGPGGKGGAWGGASHGPSERPGPTAWLLRG